MHTLLLRQLRRAFGDQENIPDALRPFLLTVSETYEQADADRQMLDHSMQTVSQEMLARNARLGRCSRSARTTSRR